MVRYYRLYRLDLSEHIRGVIEIESDDDVGAIKLAADQHDGNAMELWERARKVKTWPAPGPR